MPLLQAIIGWTKSTFMPLGWQGLFVLAFIESSFFPIPPDILLIPLALAEPRLALFFGFVCMAGSVLGAYLGYYIGLKGGRPALRRIASEEKILKVEDYFRRYGDGAICIAAFTPIPYKVFTIAAGVFRHSLWGLLWASVIGRGGRFMLEAILILFWGQAIVTFIDQYFGLLTFLIVIIIVGIYVLHRRAKGLA